MKIGFSFTNLGYLGPTMSETQFIYKIFTAEQWTALEKAGRFDGAPVDLADGFIHFSTAGQLQETAAKHFAGETGLILAAVAVKAVRDDLRWEKSRGGDLFPHLYAPLEKTQIVRAWPLDPGPGGGHVFPADLRDPAGGETA